MFTIKVQKQCSEVDHCVYKLNLKLSETDRRSFFHNINQNFTHLVIPAQVDEKDIPGSLTGV